MSAALVDEWICILSFGLTLLIEVGAVIGLRIWGGAKWGFFATGLLILSLLGLNLVTHPLAWQASSNGVPWLLCEACVILVEAVGLALIVPGVCGWEAAKLSFLLNVVSGAVGSGWGTILD